MGGEVVWVGQVHYESRDLLITDTHVVSRGRGVWQTRDVVGFRMLGPDKIPLLMALIPTVAGAAQGNFFIMGVGAVLTATMAAMLPRVLVLMTDREDHSVPLRVSAEVAGEIREAMEAALGGGGRNGGR